MMLHWPSSGSSEKIWACPRCREKRARKKCRIGSYDIFAVALAFIEDGRHCPWCFVFFNHQPISLRTDGKPNFLDLLERTSRRINSPNRPPRAAPQVHGPFRRLWRNLGLCLEPERHHRHGGRLGCHCHSCHFCIFSARFFPDSLGMLTSFRWNRWTVNAAS